MKVKARCRSGCGVPVEYFGDLCAECDAAGAGLAAIVAADIARMNEVRDMADGVY